MKIFRVTHPFFILTAMLACSYAQAQDYLITTKGDSLTGVLKPLVFGADKKVIVTHTDKKKTTYNLFQVSRFSFRNETYQPVKGPGGYTFMKVLKRGYLSLLAFQIDNQTTYDGRYLLKIDGRGIEVPNLNFKKAVTNFLSDCPGVLEKIKNGDLSKRDIEVIVVEYNACIQSKTLQPKKTEVPLVKEEATPVVDQTKLNAWSELEQKVNGQADFEGKENVLEMITEIKKKITRQEKVPNFLIQGLKESLTIPELQDELTMALNQLNP